MLWCVWCVVCGVVRLGGDGELVVGDGVMVGVGWDGMMVGWVVVGLALLADGLMG